MKLVKWIIKKFKSMYSYETSLPAYKEVSDIQLHNVWKAVKEGNNNLLQISEVLKLPQSTVSGRVNDLIKVGSLRYEGTVEFKNRKRKLIKTA